MDAQGCISCLGEECTEKWDGRGVMLEECVDVATVEGDV